MKLNLKHKHLKLLFLGAGSVGFFLRALLYATGFDGRGLLQRNHPAAIALWCLSAAALAAALFFCRKISGPNAYKDAYPVSFSASMGGFALMIALGVTGVREFSEFSVRIHLLIWVLGWICAAGMGYVAVCRLLGKKPYFLPHAALCIYFALRMVSQYRQWSAVPQLYDYCFYLIAYVALMLSAYQQAAFDAGIGKHRALWISGLMAVYLCCLSLKDAPDALILLGGAIWAFTNLTNLTVRRRRVRPALNLDDSAPAKENDHADP